MTGIVFVALFVFSAVFALGAFVFGHGADHDGGLDHGLDHGGVEGMPSIFSTRVISLFLLGFSGAGILAHYVWEASIGLSSIIGLGAGAVLGGLAYGIIVLFCYEQASSLTSPDEYIGLSGRVSGTIPQGGTGEISVVVKGQLRTLFAVTEDGMTLAEGKPVRILRVAGGTATVKAE